jgi:leucyl aminopeptidase
MHSILRLRDLTGFKKSVRSGGEYNRPNLEFCRPNDKPIFKKEGVTSMKIVVASGAIQETSADTLIVNLFAGVKAPTGATGAVDGALGGAIQELIAGGDFSGKAGEVAVLYPRQALPARRVLVVGLGKQEDFDLEGVRKAAASAMRRARALGARQVVTIVHGAGAAGIPPAAAAQALMEGSLLGLYRYRDGSKTSDEGIESLTLVEYDASKLEQLKTGAAVGEAVAGGVGLSRDLVNMPANIATPTRLAEVAQEIAQENGFSILVGDREWAAERDMGAFLAVARGAGEPPKFIVLEHNADRQDLDTLVLVGKGITFDTGGISLKPKTRLWRMKSDMAGAAAVLGAMQVVGKLDLPLHVIGIAPCTENMPDANAYHPGDVITASNGKTIEIISTDAEGRLVLADGLVFAKQYAPQAVVDLATLTGSSVTALGRGMAAGLFCNDEALQKKLIASSERTHERLWPLPLWEDYKKALTSHVADMKNSGGQFGGVGTSAIFLKQFTDFPWAHIDMAAMAYSDQSSDYAAVGATGYGVRLLVEFLRSWES